MKAIRKDKYSYDVSFVCDDFDYMYLADICKDYNVSGDHVISVAINVINNILNEHYNLSVKHIANQIEDIFDCYSKYDR